MPTRKNYPLDFSSFLDSCMKRCHTFFVIAKLLSVNGSGEHAMMAGHRTAFCIIVDELVYCR